MARLLDRIIAIVIGVWSATTTISPTEGPERTIHLVALAIFVILAVLSLITFLLT